jgi:hypothetical protein
MADFLQAPAWQVQFTDLFKLPFSERAFRANFGVSPEVCCRVWRVVMDHSDPLPKPRTLLVFLCFLKTYETFDSLGAKFGINERTVRRMVDQMAECLSNLDEVTLFFVCLFV